MLEVGSPIGSSVPTPEGLARMEFAEGFVVRHNQLFEERQPATRRKESKRVRRCDEVQWREGFRDEGRTKSSTIPRRALLAGIGLVLLLGGAKSCWDLASWAWGLQRDVAALLNEVAELKVLLVEARVVAQKANEKRSGAVKDPVEQTSSKVRADSGVQGDGVTASVQVKNEFFAATNASDWLKLVQILEAQSDIVNAKDEFGSSPLSVAARRGHYDVCKFLVHHGAHLNARDWKGETALHVASREGHLTTVSALISLGADVSVTDEKMTTPLHLASERCYPHIAQVLVGCGAEKRVRNLDNKSPVDLTCILGGGFRMREAANSLRSILQS